MVIDSETPPPRQSQHQPIVIDDTPSPSPERSDRRQVAMRWSRSRSHSPPRQQRPDSRDVHMSASTGSMPRREFRETPPRRHSPSRARARPDSIRSSGPSGGSSSSNRRSRSPGARRRRSVTPPRRDRDQDRSGRDVDRFGREVDRYIPGGPHPGNSNDQSRPGIYEAQYEPRKKTTRDRRGGSPPYDLASPTKKQKSSGGDDPM